MAIELKQQEPIIGVGLEISTLRKSTGNPELTPEHVKPNVAVISGGKHHPTNKKSSHLRPNVSILKLPLKKNHTHPFHFSQTLWEPPGQSRTMMMLKQSIHQNPSASEVLDKNKTTMTEDDNRPAPMCCET